MSTSEFLVGLLLCLDFCLFVFKGKGGKGMKLVGGGISRVWEKMGEEKGIIRYIV